MINWLNLSSQERQQALARPDVTQSDKLTNNVSNILNQVKNEGDNALVMFTAKFDGVELNEIALDAATIETVDNRLAPSRKDAIKTAYNNIRKFHAAQMPSDIQVETTPGVICTLKTEAIDSVGLYIPAGSAPLPSTVLMLGIPAQIAGCRRVVIACPPDTAGNICDEILYAAKLCGISEIYRMGGAQAIAALAYGTQSVPAVNKVFGPGNRFVTEAKKQLSQSVPGFGIDMPAGPSEVLVIADKKANASYVAADLLSQAEHGPDSQVILVTNSASLIDDVKQEIDDQVCLLPRQEIAREALEQSRFILVDSIETAVIVSNQYGPEHLIIQTQDAKGLLSSIRGAGSIFIGAYTPESAGDYASGTNHVLPTYGYSKVASSLSLADFSRRYTVQEISKQGLTNLAPTIIELTNAEGLLAHQRAVTIRLEEE